MNHATTMKRAYDSAFGPPPDKGGHAQVESPQQKMRTEIARLEEENLSLREKGLRSISSATSRRTRPGDSAPRVA